MAGPFGLANYVLHTPKPKHTLTTRKVFSWPSCLPESIFPPLMCCRTTRPDLSGGHVPHETRLNQHTRKFCRFFRSNATFFADFIRILQREFMFRSRREFPKRPAEHAKWLLMMADCRKSARGNFCHLAI